MGFFKSLKKNNSIIKNFFLKKLEIKNKNIVITGSNSGIGFQLTKLLSKKNNIIALVNKNSNNLDEIKNLKIFKNDLQHGELDNLIQHKLDQFKTNILINCAASFGSGDQRLENFDANEFKKVLNINFVAIIKLINLCLKKDTIESIVNISSEMGSIKNNCEGGFYYYRMSKTLVNALSRNLSIDLKSKKINIFCIHPGNVKTKMNSGGVLKAEISAQKIINIISENNSKFSGSLIDIDKNFIDW